MTTTDELDAALVKICEEAWRDGWDAAVKAMGTTASTESSAAMTGDQRSSFAEDAAEDMLHALQSAEEWMSCVEPQLRDGQPFKRDMATIRAAIVMGKELRSLSTNTPLRSPVVTEPSDEDAVVHISQRLNPEAEAALAAYRRKS